MPTLPPPPTPGAGSDSVSIESVVASHRLILCGPPPSPAVNLPQHQGLSSGSWHQVDKVLELQLLGRAYRKMNFRWVKAGVTAGGGGITHTGAPHVFTTTFRLHSSGWTSGGERTWWARATLRKQTARSLPLDGVQFWVRFRLRSKAAVRPGGRTPEAADPSTSQAPLLPSKLF